MDGGNGALRSVRLLHRGLLYYKRPDRNRQGDLFALEGLFDQFQALVLRDPEVSLSCVDPVVEDETYQLFPKRVENHGRRGIATCRDRARAAEPALFLQVAGDEFSAPCTLHPPPCLTCDVCSALGRQPRFRQVD